MRLICYPTSGDPPRIVAAPVERDWMDRTPNGFAYRCLPLNIANAHGWLILNTVPFIAQWNGDPGTDGVRISPTAGGPAARQPSLIRVAARITTDSLTQQHPEYALRSGGIAE